MSYSIIPPILVVLSLIGIIALIARKAPEAAKREEELKFEGADTNAKKSFWNKFKLLKRERKNGESKLLLMLEKITRRIRVIFLKLESKFSSWGDSLRKKRNGRIEKNKEDYSLRAEVGKSANGGQAGRERIFFKNERPSIAADQKIEETGKPAEKKNIFEKVLVDRIAANPKDIEAYERLGEYYLEIESWEYAKECFKQVLKLDSQNASAKLKMKKLERIL